MTRPAKIALGVASLWPLIWFFLFFIAIFGTMLWASAGSKATSHERGVPPLIMILFCGHFLTIFFMFALTAVYLVYLFRTDRVRQDKKALWAVVLFLGNAFAFPVFWYLYVWRETDLLPGE
jgi:hypothetical protein